MMDPLWLDSSESQSRRIVSSPQDDPLADEKTPLVDRLSTRQKDMVPLVEGNFGTNSSYDDESDGSAIP